MIKGLIKQLLLLSACILITVAFFACSSDENAIENRRSEQALDGGANFIGSLPLEVQQRCFGIQQIKFSCKTMLVLFTKRQLLNLLMPQISQEQTLR